MIIFLAGWFLRFLAFLGLNFTAKKLLLTAVIMVLLPIVLNNLIVKIVGELLDIASSVFSTLNPVVMSFTELTAYILYHTQFPAVISIYMSTLVVIFTLRVVRLR